MRALAILLVALVVVAASGCVWTDDDGADDAPIGFVYTADDPRKAPHELGYVGGFDSLTLRGATVELEASKAMVWPFLDPDDAPSAAEDPTPGGWTARAFVGAILRDVDAELATDDGDLVRIEDRTVRIWADRELELDGLASVRVTSPSVDDGVVHVNSDITELVHRAPALDRPVLLTSPSGATAADVRVRDEGTGEFFGSGSLRIAPGAYVLEHGSLTVRPESPFVVDGPSGFGLTGIGTAMLNDEALDLPNLSASVTDGTLTVDVGRSHVDVAVRIDQLRASPSSDVRSYRATPLLEARLTATFVDHEAPLELTVRPGDTRLLWLVVSEVGGVGAATGVQPDYDIVPVRLSVGDWHEELPGDAATQDILSGIIDGPEPMRRAYQPLTTIAPSDSMFIPLVIDVAPDASPHVYGLPIVFYSSSADRAEVPLFVTVVS